MPGVIMENGVHSNHDRDLLPNGVNGASRPNELSRKQSSQSQSRTPQPNGRQGSEGHASEAVVAQLKEATSKMPPEITHIDEGFEQLPKLLTRLAQLTHNELSAKVEELAAMGVPPPTGGLDDNSKENIAKKVSLLKFLEKQHENWTKALVITNWSRVSEDIGKLIDLQSHITERRFHYDMAFHEMSELKRGLVHAKVPNPDFKTAVEVLSTGKASWMPDLGYIEPPRLTAKELLRSLQNLNTLLSERLNFHDYDKIPYHFRNYTIKNGRVTFTVEDEFEVDLTIADEDPEKQFWFIDFRFLFTPAVPSFKEHIRFALESEVNAALEKDGLTGCYRVLHELALTHKLSELRRQAHELARGRWIHTLQVEALHRGVSIQYWKDRYGEKGPKSWIMLGPVSGKRKDGHHDEKTTSRIGVRWIRDGKEVVDANIPLNLAKLSAEELIRSVIGLHVGHILRSMKMNLKSKPLFSGRGLGLALRKSMSANGEPELLVQLTQQNTIKIVIEHITGRFAISPPSRLTIQTEARLNGGTMDPATNGHDFITNLHALLLVEETVSSALTLGWEIGKPGLQQDEIRSFVPRSTLQVSWFRRRGWTSNWFLALCSGTSGESWWLVSVTDAPKENATGIASLDVPKVKHHYRVPGIIANFLPTYEFMTKLHIFTSSIISCHTNMHVLHGRKAKYILLRRNRSSIAHGKKVAEAQHERAKIEILEPTAELNQALKIVHRTAFNLPSLRVVIESLFPSNPKISRPWAEKLLDISFNRLERARHLSEGSQSATVGNGLLSPPQTQPSHNTPSSQSQFQSQQTSIKQPGNPHLPMEEAFLMATGQARSALPPGLLDREAMDERIAFNTATSTFAFALQSRVGEPVIELLVQQIQRVSRLVDFVRAVAKHGDELECKKISLNRIELLYGYKSNEIDGKSFQRPKEAAVLEFPQDVSCESPSQTELILPPGNPHIRILDYLMRILNEPLYGLDALALNLPMTLPVVRALDTAEATWATLGLQTNSELVVFAHNSDDYKLRYSFMLPSTGEKDGAKDLQAQEEDASRRRRRVSIAISQRTRQGRPWWWIRRECADDRRTVLANDEFDKLLKEDVWSKSDVWSGQQAGAIAIKAMGVERMIDAVDAVMQKIAMDPGKYLAEPEPAPTAQTITQPAPPVNLAPTAQMTANAPPTAAPPPNNQPQQPAAVLNNRAAAMQLKLPPKRPQTQQTQAKGPPQAVPLQRNPSVPVANMRGGTMSTNSNMGGTPMAVSASMPGRPPSMTATSQNTQQGMMPGGRGKSLSPVMTKKAPVGVHGGVPMGIGIGGGTSVAAGAQGMPNMQGLNPQQMQQLQQATRMQQLARLKAQQTAQAAGGQMAQQGQQGQQGGQRKTGGVDAPMVID